MTPANWHLRDLWTEPPAGAMSVPKVCTLAGVIALTAALIIAVRARDLPFGTMVEYAISVTVLTTPVLGGRLIGLWHSRSLTPEPAPPPPGGAPKP